MSVSLHEYSVDAVLQQNPIWEIYRVKDGGGQPSWLLQLNQHWRDDADAQDLLLDSFQEAFNLHQPNVLELIQTEKDETGVYGLYAPLEAVPLLTILETQRPDPATATDWIVQLCHALQHGHLHGVVHGCLSWPALYLTSQGQVKVVGFGMRKLLDHALIVRPDEMPVFARPASPQRLAVPEQMTIADELYSVGVLYFQLLTGQPLFRSQHMQELIVEKSQVWQPHEALDEQTNHILGRLFSFDETQQYANCRELIHDLTRPDSVPLVAAQPAKNKWQQRHQTIRDQLHIPGWTSLVGMKKRIVFTATLVLLLVVVGFMMTWISQMGQEDWRNQALYDAFLAEQDSVKQQKLPESKPTLPKPAETIQPVSVAKSTPPAQKASAVLSADSISLQFAQLAICPLLDSTYTVADVYLNNRLEGQSNGSSPFIVQGLAAGRTYEVRLQKQGYATWQQRCVVRANKQNEVIAHLQPLADAVRRFTFNRVSFADRVSVDGKLPSASLPCEMDLLMGSHELRYIDTMSGFQWSTRITLDMNSARTIVFNGEQVGMGRLAIVLADPGRFGYAFVFMPGQSRTLTTPLKQRLAAGRYPLRIFREGFHTLPSDTSIYIRPDQEISIVVQMSPM